MLLPRSVLWPLKYTVVPKFSQHVTKNNDHCDNDRTSRRDKSVTTCTQDLKWRQNPEGGQNRHRQKEQTVAELEMALLRRKCQLTIQRPPKASEEKPE